jgi:hypothetical protein
MFSGPSLKTENHQPLLPPATLLRSNSVSLVLNKEIEGSICIISVPGFLSTVERVPEYNRDFLNAANFEANFDWRFPFSPKSPPTWNQWASDLQNTVRELIKLQPDINHFVLLTDSQGLALALMIDELSGLERSVDIVATRVPYMGDTRPGVISKVLQKTIDDIGRVISDPSANSEENRYLKNGNYRRLFGKQNEPIEFGAARALRLFESARESNISSGQLRRFNGRILLLPYETDKNLHSEEARSNFIEMCNGNIKIRDVPNIPEALKFLAATNG